MESELPSYHIAHIKEQGQDMIIVPLDPSFGNKSNQQQQAFRLEIQARAQAAGLAGIVVLIWKHGNNGTRFIAPNNWTPFFKGLPFNVALSSRNKILSW